MSTRIDVLLWAQRVIARKGSAPHVLLEVHEQSTAEQIQRAFHKIARTAHPDLHRHGLTSDELELVTSAYAAVAGAYQQMRSMTLGTVRMRPLKPEEVGMAPESRPVTPTSGVRTASATPHAGARTVQASPSETSAASSSGAAPAANAAQSMSPQALLYYRKAETCLNRGDLKGAILQLKLACATDPTSGFLRTALAEVETEVRSKT